MRAGWTSWSSWSCPRRAPRPVRSKASTIGAHAHLTKPFSPAAVAGVLQELIDLTPEERDQRRKSMLARASEMERLGMTKV